MDPKRRLVMYDTQGTPVARYHLEHAWPTRPSVAPSLISETTFPSFDVG